MIILVTEKFDGLRLKWLEEVGDMKLRCTFCLLRDGVAIKNDQLFLVNWKGHDRLACMSCKELYGGKPHGKLNSDNQLEGNSEGVSGEIHSQPPSVGASEN